MEIYINLILLFKKIINKTFKIFIIIILGNLFFNNNIKSQSLWQDKNLYKGGANIKKGTILKLQVDESFVISYDFQNQTDENIDINFTPERTITPFLPPVSSKKNNIKKNVNRLESRSNLKFEIAVSVNSITDDIINFTGTKFLGFEKEDSRQQFSVSGKVQLDDISSTKTFSSKNVDNFQMVLVGAPLAKTKNLPLLEKNNKENQNQNTNTPPAQNVNKTTEKIEVELSAEQKKQLLWEYINRVLGETTQ